VQNPDRRRSVSGGSEGWDGTIPLPVRSWAIEVQEVPSPPSRRERPAADLSDPAPADAFLVNRLRPGAPRPACGTHQAIPSRKPLTTR